MENLIKKIIIKYNSGETEEALILVNKLIEKEPKNYIGFKLRGALLNIKNKKNNAKLDMLKAFKLNPHDHENLNNLAVIYYEEKDFFNASKLIKLAIKKNSLNSFYWSNAGNIFYENRDYLKSKNCYLQSLKINPTNQNAIINMAQPIALIENIETAESYLKEYLKIKNSKAIEIMAILFYKNNNYDKALMYFQINYLENKNASSGINIAKIHLDCNRYLQAYELLINIKLNFDVTKIYDEFIVNFLTACAYLNKSKEGFSAIDLSLVNRKDLVYAAIASLLSKIGKIDDSLIYYEKSIELNSTNWVVRSSYLFTLTHSVFKTPEEIFNLHIKFGVDVNKNIPENKIPIINKNNKNKIKIGLISADFKDHPVMKFLMPTIKNINKDKFSLYVYDNNTPSQSKIIQDLKIIADNYINIFNKDDDAANKLILNHSLDLIIDLSGHTAGNRLPLLARRLAPTQMTWFGYPNTTGLKQIDYFICDKYLMPPNSHEKYWSEKLLYLNSSYNFDISDIDFPIKNTPSLENGYITFGSFNRASKINEDCLSAWALILSKLTNSTLKIANIEDPDTINNINKLFLSYGINTNRIIYLNRLPFKDYLEMHNSIDIMLDTWPYTGATTTFYALWMGVPVITILGNTLISNQSASILRRLNLDYLISKNKEDYIETVLKLANNIDFLNKFKNNSRYNWLNNDINNIKNHIEDFENKISEIVWSKF